MLTAGAMLLPPIRQLYPHCHLPLWTLALYAHCLLQLSATICATPSHAPTIWQPLQPHCQVVCHHLFLESNTLCTCKLLDAAPQPKTCFPLLLRHASSCFGAWHLWVGGSIRVWQVRKLQTSLSYISNWRASRCAWLYCRVSILSWFARAQVCRHALLLCRWLPTCSRPSLYVGTIRCNVWGQLMIQLQYKYIIPILYLVGFDIFDFWEEFMCVKHCMVSITCQANFKNALFIAIRYVFIVYF